MKKCAQPAVMSAASLEISHVGDGVEECKGRRRTWDWATPKKAGASHARCSMLCRNALAGGGQEIER